MNDASLLMALAGAGAGVWLAVWAYHRWRLRRLAPRRATAEPAPQPEEGGRLEPVLEPSQVPATAQEAPQRVLSPRIDALVELRLERVCSGEAVLAALPASRRAGSKPLWVEGWPEQAASEADAWELPRAGQRYSRLRAGVQLANRNGALNEIEYSEFVQKVTQWAEHLQAAADFPDMLAVVQRARELDQFAAAHDAQLALTLRARRAAWNPGYVTQHALRLGFVHGALPGRMVYAAADGTPMVGLQFETQAALADDPELAVLREVRLTLDVPHVPAELEPFARLRELAQALARAMEGWLSDEAGQPLSDEALDAIAAQLRQLYQRLDEAGLSAGSAAARRLFS
ncbi:hypothetical protein Talka_00883 [Tepidimonas alkaliphilus]|uniref:Cell division protein ZipA n=1 Tax=Tepidimonas alkaliphilus TaxID=2588942 RepID=A0A554WAD4_9BURK|nr:cell division protein ZipA C-terminal FtsZ-binding domain-containing protein [Tepidimonas alkaliphilus]TSE20536.1 hypothetical protein Talka_00883 [Tepidimonas alkaliphilus]